MDIQYTTNHADFIIEDSWYLGFAFHPFVFPIGSRQTVAATGQTWYHQSVKIWIL